MIGKRETNLGIPCIDFKKVLDMFPIPGFWKVLD